MPKLFVIHFQPLEKYPPVMNLLRLVVQENNNQVAVHVITTRPFERELFSVEGVQIHRVADWEKKMGAIDRLRLYWNFNFRGLKLLRKHRPEKMVYYETLSAGAAILYKKYVNPASEIFIHYHEYASPEEHINGMVLNRWLHRLELTMYKKAAWVSHTNKDRAAMFTRDAGVNAPTTVHAIANYPPGNWIRHEVKTKQQGTNIKKFVYVGALSLETTYIREWLDFVKLFPAKFSCAVYSDNYSTDVLPWMESLAASNISFNGSVPYDRLPAVLPQYDVGLILYKGHIPNYIYNAPNKLFEYHACGLDTLFPLNMRGCRPYITSGSYPVITAFDFDNPDEISLSNSLEHEEKVFKPSPYHYENNLSTLTSRLLDIK